jgi:uncharacterized protein involved in type VI secretion and phage assembly
MTDKAKTDQQNDDSQTPPWGDDFDAATAWSLVKNLRADKSSLQEKLTAAETARDELAATAQAAEDAKKTDDQKLADRLAAAEKAAADANRELLITKVRAKHEIPDELADFLTGSTEAEIEAQAAKLASVKPASKEPEAEIDPATGKPKPALTPGHGGDSTTPVDTDAIVASVRGKA